MKNRINFAKSVLPFLFFLNTTVFADPRIDRNFLKLPDGRWIWLKKVDDWTTRIIVGKGRPRSERNMLWSKEYEDDDVRTWAYAYFVYLKPGKLLVDLDREMNNAHKEAAPSGSRVDSPAELSILMELDL